MGHLVGIARAPIKRGPLSPLEEADIGIADGVAGDARGKRPGRHVTVVFREGWDAACRELGVDLPWTTRRANLLVEGVPVPREGQRLVIGSPERFPPKWSPVRRKKTRQIKNQEQRSDSKKSDRLLVLEVTQETQPCQVMETAHRGLRAALTPEWRGGVCCRVVAGGTIRVGDRVEVE